jgi:hypothetical protein
MEQGWQCLIASSNPEIEKEAIVCGFDTNRSVYLEPPLEWRLP